MSLRNFFYFFLCSSCFSSLTCFFFSLFSLYWRGPQDLLLWTLSHGRGKAGRPDRTYIQQPCVDTGCSLEDLLGAMDDRDEWQERFREICAGSVTWWWSYLFCYNYSPILFLFFSFRAYDLRNSLPKTHTHTHSYTHSYTQCLEVEAMS